MPSASVIIRKYTSRTCETMQPEQRGQDDAGEQAAGD